MDFAYEVVQLKSRAGRTRSTQSTTRAASLASFLKRLAEEGRAVVSPQPLANNDDESLGVLRQLDELARAGLALDLPQFSAEAAL